MFDIKDLYQEVIDEMDGKEKEPEFDYGAEVDDQGIEPVKEEEDSYEVE